MVRFAFATDAWRWETEIMSLPALVIDAAVLGRTWQRLDRVAEALFADGVKVCGKTNIGTKSFCRDKAFHVVGN